MDTFVYESESFELMKQKARNDKFTFPYLVDAAQTVARDFEAKHTPQAYVITKENSKWIIKYSGAIDNNAGNAGKANSYITEAVDQLLQSALLSRPKTESIGCKIYYRSDSLKMLR
jgi:peroxiredoxin